MDQTCCWLPAPNGHLQGIYDELGSWMARHRPSDEPSRVSVQHKRQVKEAFVGFHIGYVRNPEAIRRYGSEISVDEIRGRDGTPIPASSAFLTAAEATLEPFFTHQSGDPLPATANAYLPKLGVHPR